MEEGQDGSEDRGATTSHSGDDCGSEENKDGSDGKGTVASRGVDVGDEVVEGGSNEEESQVPGGREKEEAENAEAFVEEGDGESEPDSFNMEDFEVVDVVEDEEDQEAQCTSPSQISDKREREADKAESKHGQNKKSGSGRSHKHEERKDKTKSPKDASRSHREGERSSSGSSRSHVRARSRDKSRRASSKDRTGHAEKSDKLKGSGASDKQDNRKAGEKDRSSSHKSDHKRQDRHHSDSKRVDDKRASSKERELGQRKRESRRAEDRQVHSDKTSDKKSSQDQQNSKRRSDKYESDKRVKGRENSDEKSAAKRKQNEDAGKTGKEKDNSKELKNGMAAREETSAGIAEVSAACDSTVCESSVSCVTSSASLEKKCTHEMGSASLDKTSGISASCELISNEEHERIDGNIVEEPKKIDLKPNCRCKNNKAKDTSDTPAKRARSEVLGAEQVVDISLESKPTSDNCKQEASRCEQTPEVSGKENLVQTSKNSQKEVPKCEQGSEDSKHEEPKSKQTVYKLRQRNPKSKLATKNLKEDRTFTQIAKNESKSMAEASEKEDAMTEQVSKDHEQKDLKSGVTYEDCKWKDPKPEQVAVECEHLNPKTEKGVRKSNADSKQENTNSKEKNESSKKNSSSEDVVSKQVAEDCNKGGIHLKQEMDHSELKNVKLKLEKKSFEEDTECKQEIDGVKNEVVSKEECVVHPKAGHTEGKTSTLSEQADVSDEIKDQISKYIEMIRKEVDEKDAKDVYKVTKKMIGRPSSYKFNKVILIGDSRIKHLESAHLKETFDNLEVKCVPCLNIDNLQEVFDQVMKKKCPQGILLICSVGIYNIIGLCNNISCKKDHKPMEQPYIKSSLARPVIGKMMAMREKLRKTLGKDSKVVFTTILPVNVAKFIAHQVRAHSETTGHTPVVRSDWSNLEDTVHKVINSINCGVIKLSTRKDGRRIPWDLIDFGGSPERQKRLTEQYLENGLDPSRDATLTQMVPRLRFALRQYGANRYRQVVLLGDSRMEAVASNWPSCDAPFTILTQPRLRLRDLSEENAVVREVMGAEDSLIVVSLGTYDFLRYVPHEGCESHEPLEVPRLRHEGSDGEEWNDFMLCLKRADQLLRKVTSNCDVIITTLYSFDYHFLKNFEIQKHAATTGHVVTGGPESQALYEKLDRVKEFMKRMNRIAIKLAHEKQLPVWDVGGLVRNLSEATSKGALTLFDGAHPSPELASEIANACVSYAETSMCLSCPDAIPLDSGEVADPDGGVFARVSSISSLLESDDFSLPLSEFHDVKERRDGSIQGPDGDNKRCKSNKNLISVSLQPSPLKGASDPGESELKKGEFGEENEDRVSGGDAEVVKGPDDAEDKRASDARGESPFCESVSPASKGPSPSGNSSPFSDISCTSSKFSYLENVSPSSMNAAPSPSYDERKCQEGNEKGSSRGGSHSPAITSGGSGRRGSREASQRSKSRRFSRSPAGGRLSPVRGLRRKRSRSRERSRARWRSPAWYRRRGRRFSPENSFSPARSWRRYHSPERNYREDAQCVSHRNRSPARRSGVKERRYSQERSYRDRSPRSYTPVGSERFRESYDSRKNDWQYSSDFSATRGRHNTDVFGASQWESDSGHQGFRNSYAGQQGSSWRDENSRRSRSRSRKKRGPASKSKKSLTMQALESLHEVHARECDMYRQNPAAHPDFNKEYWAFVDKKVKSILSLGGDPYAYNLNKDWEAFWPKRLQEIFNEAWEFKRNQCISMLIANRGRCHSTSPVSSRSSVSSSRSSDASDYSRRYRRKRAKYSRSPSEERRPGEQCSREKVVRKSDKNCGGDHEDRSNPEQRDDVHRVRKRDKDEKDRKDDHVEGKLAVSEAVQERNSHAGGRQTDPKARGDVAEHAHPGRVSAQEAADRIPAVGGDSRRDEGRPSAGKVTFQNQQRPYAAAPSSGPEEPTRKSYEGARKADDPHRTRDSSEEEVSSTTAVEECCRADVIDVLEILSRLGERLGALSVPVQLLHQKALELGSGGSDTMKIFDEIDNKILLHMTGDKLRNALKGDDIPIVQKVIIQEGEQRLRLLLEKEKDRSLLFDLNIDGIATACLGKSSADTMTFVENALLYHGYTEVPEDQLKKIYVAVKREQARVVGLEENRAAGESPDLPGDSLRRWGASRRSRFAPSSSTSQPSGSAPYSPSQMSLSSDDSLPEAAHTTAAEMHWKSDFSASESKKHLCASSSVAYKCHSRASLACDGRANTKAGRHQSSHHAPKLSESYRSASKGSSKKPIKILLPKPRAPRVFVSAFNPLGEDESESEES